MIHNNMDDDRPEVQQEENAVPTELAEENICCTAGLEDEKSFCATLHSDEREIDIMRSVDENSDITGSIDDQSFCATLPSED